MSNDNVPPTVREMFASDRRRLKELERRIVLSPPTTRGDQFPGFSYPGAPSAGVASPRWYANDGIAFTTARISAATAGGGDLTVDVKHNGSLVLTLTLGAGANTALFAATFSLAPGDFVAVECTAVDGQENVSVDLYQ